MTNRKNPDRSILHIAAVFLGFVLIPPGSFAQSSGSEAALDSVAIDQTIDLKQAIEIALANNTQMKQSMLSVREAEQQIRTAWSQVMPDVSLSANYTRNLEVPVNFIPEVVFDPEGDPDALVPVAFGTDNNWSGGLVVSQTFLSGQAFVGINSSEIYKSAQSEALRATAQGVVTQTRIAYYQVLAAKEQHRLLQAQLNRIQENLEDTRKRFEQGFVDDYAVLQLEVQRDNLQPQLTSAGFAVENAIRELLDTIGLPVYLSLDTAGDLYTFDITSQTAGSDENLALKEIDRATPVMLEEDSVILEQAFDLRGDIRVLDIQQQLQQKQLNAQRSTYLPSLSANYNLQWTAAQPGSPIFFGTDEQRARSQTLMVSFNLPIFQGFSRDASVQTAKIQLKDLEVQEYQTRQTANKEILSSRQSIMEAFENNQAVKRALGQAETGYERAVIRYQNGVGTQQEVTDADLQLREAEMNYAQMVANYLTAKAQYDQATGQVPFVGTDTSALNQNIDLNTELR